MEREADFRADVTLICNSLAAGGIERVVSTLANAWSAKGRKVCVITFHDRERFYQLDDAVHHVVVSEADLSSFSGSAAAWLTKLGAFRRLKPFLIRVFGDTLYHRCTHAIYHATFGLFVGFRAWMLRHALRRVQSPVVVAFGTSVNIVTLKACAGSDTRVVISERSNPERLAVMERWDTMSRRFYGRAELVTANTRGALRTLGEFVDTAKMAFVPNPVVLAKREGDGVRRDDVAMSRVILTVGRLVHDKAHDVLLDAFAHAAEGLDEWRLVIAGGGVLRDDLHAQSARLRIASRVDWLGIIDDPQVEYRKAAMFVLPSRVEGMPNVLLEAMSNGLPAIVTDAAPGPLELVEHGETGLVVPVDDPVALAEAILRLSRDGALRRRLGAAGRARVAEHDLPHALAAWETALRMAN
jgi:glycosyltransferase involved in cell wall biosynthesis